MASREAAAKLGTRTALGETSESDSAGVFLPEWLSTVS